MLDFDVALSQLTKSTIDTRTLAESIALTIENAADIESELSLLWASFISAAQGNSLVHSQLVETMTHLACRPDVLDKTGNVIKIYNMTLWRDMPMWGWEVNDVWNRKSTMIVLSSILNRCYRSDRAYQPRSCTNRGYCNLACGEPLLRPAFCNKNLGCSNTAPSPLDFSLRPRGRPLTHRSRGLYSGSRFMDRDCW